MGFSLGAILVFVIVMIIVLGGAHSRRQGPVAIGCIASMLPLCAILAALFIFALLYRGIGDVSVVNSDAPVRRPLASAVGSLSPQLEISLSGQILDDELISPDNVARALARLILDVSQWSAVDGDQIRQLQQSVVEAHRGRVVTLRDVTDVIVLHAPGESRQIRFACNGPVDEESLATLDQIVELLEQRLAEDPVHGLPLELDRIDRTRFTVYFADDRVREIAAQISLPNNVHVPVRKPDPPVPPVAPVPPEVAEPADVVALADISKVETSTGDDRPDWVGQPEGRVGEQNAYRLIGTAGPYSSQQECRDAEVQLLRDLTHGYVERYLGQDAADGITVPTSFIESDLLKDSWIGPVESPSLGTMWELHVLLEFDDASRRQLEIWWQQAQMQQRMAYLGLGVGSVLVLLTTAFGYLKLDTATKGFYSGRLQVAAALMAVVVLAAGVALAFVGV